MFIAAQKARESNLPLHALEPEPKKTTEKCLETIKTWVTYIDKNANPPTIKGVPLEEVIKSYRECSLLYTGRPCANKFISTTQKLLPQYKNILEPLKDQLKNLNL